MPDTTLTPEILNKLVQDLGPPIPQTEVTVSLADYPKMQEEATKTNSIWDWPLMRVWVDPTLLRGQCYWGRPDPKRLGEQYKDWIVVNRLEDDP